MNGTCSLDTGLCFDNHYASSRRLRLHSIAKASACSRTTRPRHRHRAGELHRALATHSSNDEEQESTTSSAASPSDTSASNAASPASSGLSVIIAGGAIGLGVAAFLFTRLATGTVSLSTLEKTAVPLEAALSNQRPTMVEFYAGWCEVCRELTADVYQVEQEYKDKVNFVMLNVENPKWAPEVSDYRVNGIPHFVFLDSQGRQRAAAVGRLPRQVLDGNLKALASGNDLPFQRAAGATSTLGGGGNTMMGPAGTREVTPRGHS